MSDDIEVEVVPEFDPDEIRRYWLLEHGAPFVFSDSPDIIVPINEVLYRLSMLEDWMKTGKVPEGTSKPKLSVVKPDGGANERR